MSTKIPKRALKPEGFDYISLDKSRFAELIGDFQTAIKKQVEEETRVSISIEGFDDLFESADDVVKTLTASEWKGQSRIYVYIYDDAEPKYERRLSLRFYRGMKPGLEVEYGNKGKDIERMAIKQDIDAFIGDYVRDIPILLRDSTIGIASALATYLGFTVWYYTTLGQNGSLWNNVYVSIMGCWIAYFIVYLPITFIHHKLVPFFEPINPTETRLQAAWKWIKVVGVVLGVISGFITLWQMWF